MNELHQVFRPISDQSDWGKVAMSLSITLLAMLLWSVVVFFSQSLAIVLLSIPLSIAFSYIVVMIVAYGIDAIRFYIETNDPNTDTYKTTVYEDLDHRSATSTIESDISITPVVTHYLKLLSQQKSLTYISSRVSETEEVVHIDVFVGREYGCIEFELQDLLVDDSNQYLQEISTAHLLTGDSCYACGQTEDPCKRGFAKKSKYYHTRQINLCESCIKSAINNVSQETREEAQMKVVVSSI